MKGDSFSGVVVRRTTILSPEYRLISDQVGIDRHSARVVGSCFGFLHSSEIGAVLSSEGRFDICSGVVV